MKALLTTTFVLFCLIQIGKAQSFSLDADIRPRFEYRHGFGNLLPDKAKPSAFVIQRSRLNFSYGDPKLKIYISVQDISTWGDSQQLALSDGNNSFSLFQAWLNYSFTENWSLKLGRQAISYDDQRVLGEVDWAMQGRFHDAAMLKYSKNKLDVDLALAFNQETQKSVGSEYSIQGMFSYKVMQLVHAKKAWDKGSVSFLAMNNGFQKFTQDPIPLPDGVYYRQTMGTFFTLPVSFITFTGSAYLQTGKANANKDLTAYQYMLEAKYAPGKTAFFLGFEKLSGTDPQSTEKNSSFFPLYGTNHKFNGYMDYFYVGNHSNSVGLKDLYGKILVPVGNASLESKLHFFSSHTSLGDGQSHYLGTELDLVFTKALGKNVKMFVGYSQLFATESMNRLKGGIESSPVNNWGWAMLIVNPNLFKINPDQK